MSSPLDEITKILAGLSLGQSCLQSLESLRILLSEVSTSELREYAPKIDIDRLFTCLNTADRGQKELAGDILSRILQSMPPGQAVNRYEDMFLEGLVHPEDLVKELIIHELQLAADDAEVAPQLSSKVELLINCLRLVGSDNLTIANKASKVLTSLCVHGDAANVLVSPPMVQEMRIIEKKSDIIRYRIYDIIIAVCCISEEKLAVSDEAQLIQPLLAEVSSTDILVQLNALELLRNLAACRHGRDYLRRQGTIQKLANNLNEATSDALASLIVPGLLKFFGALAHFDPTVVSEYSNFTDTLFNLIEDTDVSLSIIAIETLSFIATGCDGKLILNQQGTRMENAMKRIGALLMHSNGDVRRKTLHCLAELFHINSDEIESDALLKTVECWFFHLDPKPISLLMNIMKQPFNDVRIGSLNIFLQLSSQPWAQRIMSQQPGFLEFLLDRRSEPNKECLERKFEIVQTLTEKTASDVWDSHSMAQLREHVREGPWFIRGQSSVAFESNP